MAKSSKSQNPEFLERRRRAIAELAKRRVSGPKLVPSAVSLGAAAKRTAVVGPVGYTVRPQPQQN